MAAWEISELPWLQEDFRYTRLVEHMWLGQAPHLDDDELIQLVLQKQLIPENQKSKSSFSISPSFAGSQFVIDALTSVCFMEDENLHPLITSREKQVAATDSLAGFQSFNSTRSQSSHLIDMESASQSVDEFSSIGRNSTTLPLSSSVGRQTTFNNDSNFRASLSRNSLSNKASTPPASGACTAELANVQGLGSTSIGTVPPPPRASATALDASPSVGTGTKRVGKKRSRASRRPPTTVLEADSSNFRAMVQQLTGIPQSPFFSSPLQHSTFEHQLGSHGLGGLFTTGPRPNPQSFTGQSSISGQSMGDQNLMQSTARPTSLAQASYTYGNHPLRANELNTFPLLLKRPTSESQQNELDQPNLATDRAIVSESSAKHLNPSSLFQSLGYSDHMAALLSSRDQVAAMPSDRSYVWDSKQDRSLSSLGFDEPPNVNVGSMIAKDNSCPEQQFAAKPMRSDHLHGATDVDISASSSKATSSHVVDSWLSHTD